jgi:hypothetical protein
VWEGRGARRRCEGRRGAGGGVIGPAWHAAGSLELARGWCGWVVWAKGWVTGTRAGRCARAKGRRGHAHGLHY